VVPERLGGAASAKRNQVTIANRRRPPPSVRQTTAVEGDRLAPIRDAARGVVARDAILSCRPGLSARAVTAMTSPVLSGDDAESVNIQVYLEGFDGIVA